MSEMRIVKLIAENIKRLSVVEITPDGGVVILNGRNEQGKSSVLDSIFYALGGERALPSKPVRNGKKKGSIFLDLGDITVERVITAKGGGSLKVLNKEGVPQKSPQTLLNSLVGPLSFDPLAFSRMDPPKQAEVVRMMAGITFDDLDEMRATTYEARTTTKRLVKDLEGQLSGLPEVEAPPAEVSMADLLKEEATARAAAEAKKGAIEAVVTIEDDIEQSHTDIANERLGIEQQQAEIEEQQAALKEMEEIVRKLVKNEGDLVADREKALKAHELLPTPPDIEEIRERMGKVEDTNRLVRQASKRAAVVISLDEYRKKVGRQSASIEDIDDQKIDRVAKAKLPVPGLGFDEEGLTLDGIPFEQCSTAVSIRTSVAIGLAQNPKLKILLIREGSLLDKDNLALVIEMAKEAKADVWIECVGDGSEGGILIEDGMVGEYKPEDSTSDRESGFLEN